MQSIIEISRRFLKLSPICLLGVGLLALTGCHEPKIQMGHYEGELTLGSSWKPGAASFSASQMVGIDIQQNESEPIVFRVSDVNQNNSFKIIFTKTASNTYEIGIPQHPPIPFKPEKLQKHTLIGDMKCYVDYSAMMIKLCLSHNEITLNIAESPQESLLSLAAGRFSRSGPFELETPREFSLDEAIRIALTKNFASRTEYHQLNIAKDKRKASYLGLLPHIRVNTGLGVAGFATTLNPLSLLADLGDLAPFLFPSRWLAARAAGYQERAVQDSYRIMQANLGAQVETLANSLFSNQSQVRLYEAAIAKTRGLIQKMLALELEGRVVPGSTATIESSAEFLEFAKQTIEGAVTSDRRAIAESMGFLNPEAVQGIRMDDTLPAVDLLYPLKVQRVAELARDRSLESRQIGHLIQAAKDEKTSLYFSWLDPNGDAFAPLGFNLPSQISAAGEYVEILIEQQEKRRQEAIQQGLNTAKKYNGLLTAYEKAIQFKEAQEYRMEQTLQRLNEFVLPSQNSHRVSQQAFSAINRKHPVTAYEIHQVIQDYLTASLLVEGFQANIRATRCKVDRVLLFGYFSVMNEFSRDLSFIDVKTASAHETGENSERDLSSSARENPYLLEMVALLKNQTEGK